jgi:hypothetical protein
VVEEETIRTAFILQQLKDFQQVLAHPNNCAIVQKPHVEEGIGAFFLDAKDEGMEDEGKEKG